MPEATCLSAVSTPGDTGPFLSSTSMPHFKLGPCRTSLHPCYSLEEKGFCTHQPSTALQNTGFTICSGLVPLGKALARGSGSPLVGCRGDWPGSPALPAPLLPPACYTSQAQSRSGCFSDNQRFADVFLWEKNQLIMCRTKRLFSSEIILPSCKGTCLWANLEED